MCISVIWHNSSTKRYSKKTENVYIRNMGKKAKLSFL